MNRILKKIRLSIAYLATIGRLILFGRPLRSVSDPRAIVIVQLAKLGDMVCTTPMFAAIKKTFPSCRVIVVGAPGNRSVLENNPHVDIYISSKGNFLSVIAEIRSHHPDAGCVTAPSLVGLLLLLLARVPLVVAPEVAGGFSPYQTPGYRSLLPFVKKVPHHFGSYAPGEYLRLLAPMSIEATEIKKYLGFSADAEKKVGELLYPLAGGPIVGIAPGAGNKIKCWQPEKFAEVARYLSEKYGAHIVLTGGPGDREAADKMMQALGSGIYYIDTVGKIDVDELKALISKLDLFIAVDSGPIYIAEAFDVPTVDIVGPCDEREQPPVGEKNRIVKLDGRVPELHVMNARVYNRVEARRQVEEISVGMVKRDVDELMNNILNKK